MNHARSWKQEQERQRNEASAIMFVIVLGLAVYCGIMLALAYRWGIIS